MRGHLTRLHQELPVSGACGVCGVCVECVGCVWSVWGCGVCGGVECVGDVVCGGCEVWSVGVVYACIPVCVPMSMHILVCLYACQ